MNKTGCHEAYDCLAWGIWLTIMRTVHHEDWPSWRLTMRTAHHEEWNWPSWGLRLFFVMKSKTDRHVGCFKELCKAHPSVPVPTSTNVSQSCWGLFTVIVFSWVSAKFGPCIVVSVNGTLVEAKMCAFTLESTHFIFNKCPFYTHDGASVKFSTNSHETDYSVPVKAYRK
jgi:hypothetical protein